MKMLKINEQVEEVLSSLSNTELIFIVGQMDRVSSKIGNICVEVSSKHIDPEDGIERIRKCLMMLPHLHCEEVLKMDIENSETIRDEYDCIWDIYVGESKSK